MKLKGRGNQPLVPLSFYCMNTEQVNRISTSYDHTGQNRGQNVYCLALNLSLIYMWPYARFLCIFA